MPKWSHYLEADDEDEDRPVTFEKIKKGQRGKPDDEPRRREPPDPRRSPINHP